VTVTARCFDCPNNRRRPSLDAELIEDVLEMLGDRAWADTEDHAGLGVRLALRDPAEHVSLPLGQPEGPQ
jgi:hypothetical protein